MGDIFKGVGWMAALVLLAPASLGFGQVAGSSCVDCDGAELVSRLGMREAPEPVRDRPGWATPRRIAVRGGEEMIDWLRASAPGVELVAVADLDSLLREAPRADAVLGFCTPAILEAAPRLKWIQLWSAGAEYCVNIPALRERDILLTNTQRVSAPEIGEHVMAVTLAFARGLHRHFLSQTQERWNRDWLPQTPPWELDGKTVLMAGLGGTGTEVARRAHALGMRVVATRRSGRQGPDFVDYVGLSHELNELAEQADVVVNCLPLTAETTGIFDADFFAQMKKSAYFINVGRGKSVITRDLVAALRSGQIAGAGLDVIDPEPLPAGHPLWSLPNVIITPHAASESDLSSHRQMLLIRENLRRYVAGERMLSVVDPASGY